MLAAEVHTLVLELYHAYIIRGMIGDIRVRKMYIEVLVDSKTLLDVFLQDGRTCKKCLQIYLYSIKESYVNGELARIN